jgi:hypothetical protein
MTKQKLKLSKITHFGGANEAGRKYGQIKNLDIPISIFLILAIIFTLVSFTTTSTILFTIICWALAIGLYSLERHLLKRNFK